MQELTHWMRQLGGILALDGRESEQTLVGSEGLGSVPSLSKVRHDSATEQAQLFSETASNLDDLLFTLLSQNAPPSSSNCSDLRFELRESRSWRLESCLQELGGQKGLSAWEPPGAPFRFISTHY